MAARLIMNNNAPVSEHIRSSLDAGEALTVSPPSPRDLSWKESAVKFNDKTGKPMSVAALQKFRGRIVQRFAEPACVSGEAMHGLSREEHVILELYEHKGKGIEQVLWETIAEKYNEQTRESKSVKQLQMLVYQISGTAMPALLEKYPSLKECKALIMQHVERDIAEKEEPTMDPVRGLTVPDSVSSHEIFNEKDRDLEKQTLGAYGTFSSNTDTGGDIEKIWVLGDKEGRMMGMKTRKEYKMPKQGLWMKFSKALAVVGGFAAVGWVLVFVVLV